MSVTPRFPKQIENVHAPHVHIALAALLGWVPEHAQNARPALKLLPPHVRIRLLKSVLFQDHGQHGGQHRGIRPISLFARKHHRLGVIVHCVGVLVEQAVQQPRARRFRIARIAGWAHALPMAQAIPLIVFHHARIERRLAAPVFRQQLLRFCRHRMPFFHIIVASLCIDCRHRRYHFIKSRT